VLVEVNVVNGVVYDEHDPGPSRTGRSRRSRRRTEPRCSALGSLGPGPISSPAVADGEVFTEDDSGGSAHLRAGRHHLRRTVRSVDTDVPPAGIDGAVIREGESVDGGAE
jgi:hypothetical protein